MGCFLKIGDHQVTMGFNTKPLGQWFGCGEYQVLASGSTAAFTSLPPVQALLLWILPA